MSARQRLRRATRESLAIPAFSSPIDCTPWVIGGLWPAELSTETPETATLAEHLKADLQRIADAANHELKLLKRAGMSDVSRQAAEARVIDEARGRAVRRVESTIRYLHGVRSGAQAPAAPPPRVQPPTADPDKTRVLPVIRDVNPAEEVPAQSPSEPPQRPGRRRRRGAAAAAEHPPGPAGDQADSGRHHAVADEPVTPEPQVASEPAPDDEPAGGAAVSHLEQTQVIPVVAQVPVEHPPGPAGYQADSGRHHVVADEPVTGTAEPQVAQQEDAAEAARDTGPGQRTEKPVTPTGFDNKRLDRLLEFVVRQEPRLNWAIGDRADGTTVLVTDLAHGWIPSGITLPAGVQLLQPERRSGKVAALIGETARVVTYAPGDSLHRSIDFAATRSSVQPRTLPAIDDLASVLSATTRRRNDLPKIVPRLAEAAATGTVVVDQEVDVLRVHLDTARYQLLVQYPNVNPALLLKCLLMAATEGIASGDAVSANYHLAWYQKLDG